MVKPETKHICESVVMDIIERYERVYGNSRVLELSKRITDIPFNMQLFLMTMATRDCRFENEKLRREMGHFMYAIYYDCYINNTYCIPLDAKKVQKLSGDLNTDINIWAAFLNAAISNGLIDKDMYEKKSVITSNDIISFYNDRLKVRDSEF